MGIIQRELIIRCSHFEIGDYVAYSWFRGEIVSINYPQLQQLVRVVEVRIPAANRVVGNVHRVPFNMGELVERPERRNYSEDAQYKS